MLLSDPHSPLFVAHNQDDNTVVSTMLLKSGRAFETIVYQNNKNNHWELIARGRTQDRDYAIDSHFAFVKRYISP